MGRLSCDNLTLTIAATNYARFFIMEKDTKHNTFISGIEGNLLNILSSHLDFRIRLLPAFTEWGMQLANGTWVGMVGSVVKKEADIALTLISLTYQRHLVVDFSFPYFFDQVTFLTKHPEKEDNLMAFLEPFSLSVWLLLFGSMAFQIFFMTLVMKILSRVRSESQSGENNSFHCAWKIFQNFMLKREFGAMESSDSLRFSLVPWWLLVIVVSNAYAGQLISFITLPSVLSPIDSMKDLLRVMERTNFGVVAISHSSYRSIFTEKANPEYRILNKKMIQVENSAEAYRLAVSGRAAFLTGKTLILADSDIPDLHYARDGISIDFLGMVFAKSFRYKENFNLALIRLIETGHFVKWNSKAHPNHTSNNVPRSKSQEQALRIEDYRGIILTSFSSMVLTTLIMLIELVINRQGRRVPDQSLEQDVSTSPPPPYP